jgi:hypothetical protein
MFRRLKITVLPLMLLGLMACASTNTNGSMAKSQAMEIYEVHHDGRINVFYDRKLYKGFLKMGETPYRLTRIGAGPKGETLVFGLTKHDKKLKHNIPAIDLYDGKIKASDNFYAEMVAHNRIFVFDNYQDMQTVRQFGHPNYMYTQIGAGPNGETVVFVLNKHNKKKRPDNLIKKFNSMS